MNNVEIKNLVKLTGYSVAAQGKEQSVSAGFTSDLLSLVMSDCEPKSIWITNQRHLNILAVAQLKSIPAIVIAGGLIPKEDVLKKAREEGITVLTTGDSAFVASGKIYQLFDKES